MIPLHPLTDCIVAENSSQCLMARVFMAHGLEVVGAEFERIRSRADGGGHRG